MQFSEWLTAFRGVPETLLSKESKQPFLDQSRVLSDRAACCSLHTEFDVAAGVS